MRCSDTGSPCPQARYPSALALLDSIPVCSAFCVCSQSCGVWDCVAMFRTDTASAVSTGAPQRRGRTSSPRGSPPLIGVKTFSVECAELTSLCAAHRQRSRA
eukprot:2847811-Rhodomonas_salina.2